MKTRKYILFYLFLFFYTLLYAQQSPDVLYGDLFREVQMQRVFKDSKTFPDCISLYSPDSILKKYTVQSVSDSFNLKRFVLEHFILPQELNQEYRSDTSLSVKEHIEKLWPVLMRQADTIRNSSLLPLPHPYIVPGGRFREIYYWDSYFTMLGLRESGMTDMMQNMTDNFAYLINTYGFIPNGNRSYYLSRSQPPFFALMVDLLEKTKGEEIIQHYLPALEKEYQFWMNGTDSLNAKRSSYRRVVRMKNGSILNRYWDDRPVPRPESYREDVALSKLSSRPPEELYRDIRAACESGWDFSSRWLKDPDDLKSIHTTDIIPVDLNCLLYFLETTLARAYEQSGDTLKKNLYLKAAKQRKEALLLYCWDKDRLFFYDYDFYAQTRTFISSLASVYPLYFGLCDTLQALYVAEGIMKPLLQDGGLLATLVYSGEQWDAPNGWAPLHYLCVEGFLRYGFRKDAMEITQRWTGLNEKVFKNTGKMLEKYNVMKTHLKGGGGEYPLQDGFGWTNGVYLYLSKYRK